MVGSCGLPPLPAAAFHLHFYELPMRPLLVQMARQGLSPAPFAVPRSAPRSAGLPPPPPHQASATAAEQPGSVLRGHSRLPAAPQGSAGSSRWLPNGRPLQGGPLGLPQQQQPQGGEAQWGQEHLVRPHQRGTAPPPHPSSEAGAAAAEAAGLPGRQQLPPPPQQQQQQQQQQQEEWMQGLQGPLGGADPLLPPLHPMSSLQARLASPPSLHPSPGGGLAASDLDLGGWAQDDHEDLFLSVSGGEPSEAAPSQAALPPAGRARDTGALQQQQQQRQGVGGLRQHGQERAEGGEEEGLQFASTAAMGRELCQQGQAGPQEQPRPSRGHRRHRQQQEQEHAEASKESGPAARRPQSAARSGSVGAEAAAAAAATVTRLAIELGGGAGVSVEQEEGQGRLQLAPPVLPPSRRRAAAAATAAQAAVAQPRQLAAGSSRLAGAGAGAEGEAAQQGRQPPAAADGRAEAEQQQQQHGTAEKGQQGLALAAAPEQPTSTATPAPALATATTAAASPPTGSGPARTAAGVAAMGSGAGVRPGRKRPGASELEGAAEAQRPRLEPAEPARTELTATIQRRGGQESAAETVLVRGCSAPWRAGVPGSCLASRSGVKHALWCTAAHACCTPHSASEPTSPSSFALLTPTPRWLNTLNPQLQPPHPAPHAAVALWPAAHEAPCLLGRPAQGVGQAVVGDVDSDHRHCPRLLCHIARRRRRRHRQGQGGAVDWGGGSQGGPWKRGGVGVPESEHMAGWWGAGQNKAGQAAGLVCE